jgi:hypothetical protein
MRNEVFRRIPPMSGLLAFFAAIGLLQFRPVGAQGSGSSQSGPGMATMSMGAEANDPGAFLMQMASGTSINPASGGLPMVMHQPGNWRLMFMGQGYAVDTQQTGPRGRDKFYSVNWGMIAGEHRVGRGEFLVQSMFSLEPATITDRSYPELFQTGETAYGVPLVDAQHPHNFIMALGAQYVHPLGESGILQLYYAPVGDPALGPVAFPHRASAEDLPQAPLGHHWEDSTHIAGDVATAALKERRIRVEASGFYGTEPGENRWTIPWGPMNSWSGRVSVAPSANWVIQASAGRLTHPERQTAGDIVRLTGSVQYSRPSQGGQTWSSALIWGRNHEIPADRNLNAYLAETVVPLGQRNTVTGRAEVVSKDDLFADSPKLEQQLASSVGTTFQVHAYTAGYTRTLRNIEHVETAIGANATCYRVPESIQPYYGQHPFGVDIYVRFRLTGR